MIRDQLSTKTVALPAAGATAVTASLDLKSTNPGPLPALQVELELPDLENLVDAKTVSVILEHSADDVTFVTVPTVGNMVVTGAGGAGAAAKVWRFNLPPDVKRYIRGSATVLAAGGDNTASALTLALAA